MIRKNEENYNNQYVKQISRSTVINTIILTIEIG